jgi:hypothetical protein
MKQFGKAGKGLNLTAADQANTVAMKALATVLAQQTPH